MHCHTDHSPDCFMKPAVLARAARKAGLDAIFVTDHERLGGFEALRDVGGELHVFPGQEIRTSRGEIIGLFVSEAVSPGLPPEEALKRLREQGALAYLPHPFARLVPSRLKREAVERLASRFDVVEVANSRNVLRADDRRAGDFAARHGLLRGGGSDAHWPWDLGRAYVELPPFDSPETLKASLATARVVDRAKSSYLLSAFNAAIYPFREAWWNLIGDRRALRRL